MFSPVNWLGMFSFGSTGKSPVEKGCIPLATEATKGSPKSATAGAEMLKYWYEILAPRAALRFASVARWTTLCPAFSRADAASAKLLRTGGCRVYSGSSGKIPIVRGFDRGSSRALQERLIALPSYLHGLSLVTTSMRSDKSSAELANGPRAGITADIQFMGHGERDCPANGMRSTVGLKPYTPQQKAGMRTEPARSLPMPRGDPRNATSAPSPPLEPPAVNFVLCELSVRPKMLFSESQVWTHYVSEYCLGVVLSV